MPKRYPKLMESRVITPPPMFDPRVDPMVAAKSFERWCNTLPGVRRAHAWRSANGAYHTPYKEATHSGAVVRVYIDWTSGFIWNQGAIPAVSYVQFLPGPLAFVHRDAPQEQAPPSLRAAQLAAIRAYVGGQRDS
jgi:hypothetical protein